MRAIRSRFLPAFLTLGFSPLWVFSRPWSLMINLRGINSARFHKGLEELASRPEGVQLMLLVARLLPLRLLFFEGMYRVMLYVKSYALWWLPLSPAIVDHRFCRGARGSLEKIRKKFFLPLRKYFSDVIRVDR